IIVVSHNGQYILFLLFFNEFLQKLETPKKGTQQERVQKVDHNLDKETIAKKMEIDKLSKPKVMKDHAHGDKEVVQ
ncbi:hypothetical protein RYX36_031712, partial [Vicia faba]